MATLDARPQNIANVVPAKPALCVLSGFLSAIALTVFALWISVMSGNPSLSLAAPVIETPVFALMAKRAYVRHERV